MKRPFLLMLGAIVAWAGGWIALTMIPRVQLSAVRAPAALRPYSDLQQRGRAVYVANGCLYCHSQQPRAPDFGPDSSRGWGRASVPGDYYYDDPHLLGTSRTGPDLFNIGVRQPNSDWHLIHLYQPRAVSPGSVMPAYRFLFEEKVQAAPGDRVVPVPAPWVPPGKVVIATAEALALVEYLRGLDRSYPVDVPPGSAHEH
jgi:cytochrome c oxidase cbb3-type subunit 2